MQDSFFDSIRSGNLSACTSVIDANPAIVSEALSGGLRPLHCAVKYRQNAIFDLLLSKGADINLPGEESGNRNGYTVFHYAAENDDGEMIARLAALGADVSRVSSDRWSPLHLACFKGRHAAIVALVEAGADVDSLTSDGQSALFFCVEHGKVADARFLLQCNASTDFEDPSGNSLMHYALHFTFSKLFDGKYVLADAQLDVSVTLAVYGVDPSRTNADGEPPTLYIKSVYASFPRLLASIYANSASFKSSAIVWNFNTFMSAQKKHFVDAGIAEPDAVALYQCVDQLRAERFLAKESQNRTTQSAAPPVTLPEITPGVVDPSGGRCPFFQKSSNLAAGGAQIPQSHRHFTADQLAQTGADPSGGRCPHFKRQGAPSSVHAGGQCPFSWKYVQSHSAHLTCLLSGALFGVLIDRWFLSHK